MATYRLIEVRDKLISKGEPRWKVEKLWLGLWWTEYFEEHTYHGATFYDKEEAMIWYQYHVDGNSRITTKVIAQNG